MATIRTCRKCGDTQELEKFQKDKSCPSGYRHVCKACKNIAVLTNEQRRDARKKYVANWKKENPDYGSKWKAANKDRVKANARKWYTKSYETQPARWLYTRARRRAKQEGLQFDITVSDIHVPDICPALGIHLVINKNRVAANSPSLDRIEPDLGYTKGNIIVVSMLANAIKTNATPEQIIAVGEFYADLKRQKSSAT